MSPLWSLPQFCGFNRSDFCLYKSKCHCNVYLKHLGILLNLDLNGLPYPFKNYSKFKNLDFFRLRFFETSAAMQSVFTRFAVTNINWWNCPWKVDSTFLFLPLLGQEKQSNVKLKPSIHKYPTPSIWPKYHLWMPILKRTGLCIQVLGCNMHFSDILCV